jgi:hypothetical protein
VCRACRLWCVYSLTRRRHNTSLTLALMPRSFLRRRRSQVRPLYAIKASSLSPIFLSFWVLSDSTIGRRTSDAPRSDCKCSCIWDSQPAKPVWELACTEGAAAAKQELRAWEGRGAAEWHCDSAREWEWACAECAGEWARVDVDGATEASAQDKRGGWW